MPSTSTEAVDEGFSLVELLVAITILVVVSLSLLGALIGGLRAAVASEQRTRANETATDVLEGLRSVPWNKTGYYKSELDAYLATPGHASPPYGESPVVVSAAPPSPRPADVPHAGPVTVLKNGVTYRVTTWVTWVGAANDGTKYAPKRVSTDVTWTVQGRSHSLHAEGVRAPVASEMTPPSGNPAAKIVTASVTPDADTTTPDVVDQNLDASQKTRAAIDLAMTTDIAARSATVSWTLSGATVPTVVPMSSTNGTTWTTPSLPIGTGPFDATAPVLFTFSTQTSTGETDAVSRYVTFHLPAAVPPFTIASTTTPAGQQLSSSNRTTAPLAFSVTTSRRALSPVVVRYNLAGGAAAADVTLSNPSGDGVTWTGSLATGAGPFDVTQPATFAYVARSDPEGLIAQQAVTVPFTAPPAASPVINTATGIVVVDGGTPNKACNTSNNTTVSFSVSNATSAAVVTVRTGTGAVANASYAGKVDAGEAPVFTFTWAYGTTLPVTSGKFPITVNATSDGRSAAASNQNVTVSTTNSGQCKKA